MKSSSSSSQSSSSSSSKFKSSLPRSLVTIMNSNPRIAKPPTPANVMNSVCSIPIINSASVSGST